MRRYISLIFLVALLAVHTYQYLLSALILQDSKDCLILQIGSQGRPGTHSSGGLSGIMNGLTDVVPGAQMTNNIMQDLQSVGESMPVIGDVLRHTNHVGALMTNGITAMLPHEIQRPYSHRSGVPRAAIPEQRTRIRGHFNGQEFEHGTHGHQSHQRQVQEDQRSYDSRFRSEEEHSEDQSHDQRQLPRHQHHAQALT